MLNAFNESIKNTQTTKKETKSGQPMSFEDKLAVFAENCRKIANRKDYNPYDEEYK
jgi:hypothetical protein